MKILYADNPPIITTEKSIFLVGPTPRNSCIVSWRPEAIRILENNKFDGTVLVPERSDWSSLNSYIDQVDWEYECLKNCSIIAAWVPRDMACMPALTTNTELGYWLAKTPQKVFYARPTNAPHTRYQDWLYQKETGRKPIDNLVDLIKESIKNAN